MKKSSSLLFLTLSLTFVLSSCNVFGGWNCKEGKEKVTTEKRDLQSFTSVELNLPGKVFLNKVNPEAPKTIEITTNADLIEYITTEIKDGKLIISADPCIDPKDELTFQLTVGDLQALNVNGSGDIITNKKFTLESIDLSINGSGDMELDLEAKQVNININGSGDVKLSGSSTEMDININGSGDVEAPKFETVNTSVSIQGSGDTEVRVTGTLEADVMGSGDVTYSGRPENVKTNIMGSGDVEGR